MATLNVYAFAILLLGGLALTIGDIVFKQWIGQSRPELYAIGFGLYLFALVLLIKSYRYENIAVASSVLDMLNVITLAVVSWLVFKEPLSGMQMAGIGTAILAVILLELG